MCVDVVNCAVSVRNHRARSKIWTRMRKGEYLWSKGVCVCVCVCVLIICLPVGRFLTEKFSNVTQLCRRDRQRQRTDTADLLRRHTGEKSPNLT